MGPLTFQFFGDDFRLLEQDLKLCSPGGRWTARHLHLREYCAINGAIVRCYPNRTIYLQGNNGAADALFKQLRARNLARDQFGKIA